MDIKDICNAGGDILEAVVDAVSRNDYRGLSDTVENRVCDLIDQAKEEINRGSYGTPKHQYGKTTYTRQGQASYRRAGEPEQNRYSTIYNEIKNGAPYQSIRREVKKLPQTVITRYPAGKISGPIELAWGILATCGFGITALVMFIMMFASGELVYVILTAIFSLLTGASVVNIVHGSKKIGLVNRFYRYANLIGNRGFIAIEELAVQTGQNVQQVLRDLKKMMQKRMFPQGRLDKQQTTFLLTQDAYQQYMEAEQARIDREKETIQQQKQEEQNAYDTQTSRILKEGNDYIRMVRECNDKIPGEVMSDKLSRLEMIMQRIFEQVEKHPESAEDLHKFMDYYLPTTRKLLQAYTDLDRQPVSGEHISATKREIESTLDIINSAFEKLLDGMFEDTAWDISSDISVMKTMMAQEGLMGKRDFEQT